VTDSDESADNTELKQRLAQLEEELAHQLRARGFDPAQRANIPMPPAMSKLLMEIERLRDELESSGAKEND